MCETRGAQLPESKNSVNLVQTIASMSTSSPGYHFTHAYDVAKKIKDKMNNNTVVFGVITDSHVMTGDQYEADTKLSIRRAAFALDTVGKMVGADFVANLGDNQWENNIDTDNALKSLEYLNDSPHTRQS